MPAVKPPKRLKILFADDERSLQELMKLELPRLGHDATVCPDGLSAVAALEKATFDCAIVDLDMPGLNGIGVIAKLKELSPDTEAVILTGKSTTESAIAAVRLGAFDYLTKPCKLVELQALLERVASKRELTNKYRAVKRRLDKLEGPSQLIGTSRIMDEARRLIARVAPSDSTVLVRGETGTGKELAARSIHDQSLRADKPFVAINCGALPEALIESELFGHRKGSFTGADQHRVGLFEVADGGTLFLDEIGELPKGLQAKLLRFMESGEIRRVGDNESFVVDVRVVCATHRDLEKMVIDGDFREDLLFRMNTFEVVLPSLRQRKDDIPLLARHLLRRFRPHLQANEEAFSPEAVRLLQEYAWSGNVRELANVVEHAAILCDGLPIRPEHLPARKFELRRYSPPVSDSSPIAAAIVASIAPAAAPAPAASGGSSSYSSPASASHSTHSSLAGPHFTLTGTATLRDIELQVIQQVLDRCHGNKPKAADELGISLKTLYNKLNQIAEAEKAG